MLSLSTAFLLTLGWGGVPAEPPEDTTVAEDVRAGAESDQPASQTADPAGEPREPADTSESTGEAAPTDETPAASEDENSTDQPEPDDEVEANRARPAPPVPIGQTRKASSERREVREAARADEEEVEEDEPVDGDRTGLVLRGRLGVAGCLRDWCRDNAAKARPGPLLGVSFGYRPRWWLSVLARFDGQWMRVDADSEDINASAFHIGVAADVELHVVKHARFDPYFGAGLGLSFYREKFEFESSSAPVTSDAYIGRFRRAGGSLAAGLDVYLRPSLAVGPQFRYTVPFAGQYCAQGSTFVDADGMDLGDTASSCASVSDAFPNNIEDDLPHIWALSFAVTWML